MAFKIPDTPEELFRQGRYNMPDFSKWLPMFTLVFVLLTVTMTSFYSIEPDEVGVIRRFGKFIRATEPGLHWKLPFNLEQLDKVKVKRIFKEEFGFRTMRSGIRSQYETRSYQDESQMLTGDLNVLDVTWIVQFKIKDPVKLLFKVRNPRETLRNISEAVMTRVIGDSTVSEALATRRIEINAEVQSELQQIMDTYESGLDIETVKLQDVNPPDAVKPSFNEVNEAKQEKEKVINQAWEAYNKAVPRARGEAEKLISQAEGYALSRVNEAQGDAAKFTSLWDAYKIAETVTRRRMYLETLQDILPRAGNIYVFEPDRSGILPLLNLTEKKSE